ncbi:MAG: hypothetical protein JXP36_20510 [Bacteroidales bacterium]|nr:hypothetical protein [Bacteroidales bacterium]
MKRLLGILLFFFSIQFVNAQETFQRISVDFSLSHPIQKKNYFPDYRYYLDQKIEVLLNFKAGKSAVLSTGLGVQQGEHYRLEEITYLWIDDTHWRPTDITNNWKFQFKSILIPVNLKILISNSFLDYFIVNNNIGRIFDYDISEHSIPDVSHVEINKTFWDLSFGIGKKIFQSKNFSFDLMPILGSRFYLTKNNEWQTRYFYYQIKLSVNL